MPHSTPARVLAEIVLHGPDHRAALARTLRVSRTAISNAVQSLEAAGVVEIPARSEDRPTLKDAVRLTPRFGVAGSIVMTSTAVAVGVGTFDGGLRGRRITAIDAETGGAQRLEIAVTMLRELLASATPEAEMRAVHVALNTQSDRRTGEVLGGLASRQWAGTNPKAYLESALGVPVVTENTARLLALTEQDARTGPAAQDLIYVHLSHGITLGHVVDGVIIAGVRGGAGEFGHVSIDRDGRPCECGSRGCLMQYAGLRALGEQATQLLGPEAGIRDLFAEAVRTPGDSRDAVTRAALAVGAALAGVCNLLGPGILVLGGDIAPAESLVLGVIDAELRARALPMATADLQVDRASASQDESAVLDAGVRRLRWDPQVRELVVEGGLGAAVSTATP